MLCISALTIAQEVPRFEAFGGWSYLRPDGGETGKFAKNGWNATITINVNEWFGIDIEGTGHYGSYQDSGFIYRLPEIPGEWDPEEDADGFMAVGDLPWDATVKSAGVRSHSLAFGPKFVLRQNERFQPFWHALFGMRHNSADQFERYVPEYYRVPTAEEVALDESLAETGVLVPARERWESDVHDNVLMIFGGGLDVVMDQKWSIRVFQTDYALERTGGDLRPDFRFNAGVVYKLGQK